MAKYKISTFVLGLFAMILLQGCACNITVKQDEPILFLGRSDKLPLNIGLYLSDDERKYVFSTKKMFSCNFLVGEALEAYSVKSLEKVFQTVSIIHEKKNITADFDRIISIKFGTASELKYGANGFFFSEYISTIELICKVFDKEWNLLWEGASRVTTSGTVEATESIALAFVPLVGSSPYKTEKMRETVNKSLVAALEQLNEQILSLGKEAILKAQ